MRYRNYERGLLAFLLLVVSGIAAFAAEPQITDTAKSLDGDERNDDLQLITATYDVSSLLVCPLGEIHTFLDPAGGPPVRKPVPPTPLQACARDQFVGTNTWLGSLVDRILMDERLVDGTNQIAPRNGTLDVTATKTGHAHVKKFFEALSIMPAMNPQKGGVGLGPDRCVSVFVSSMRHGDDQWEWILYDVSDFYIKSSEEEIETAIQMIDRDSWVDATGGGNQALFYEPARAFLIVAKTDLHEKIKALFAKERGLQPQKKIAPRAPKKPPRRVPPKASPADE